MKTLRGQMWSPLALGVFVAAIVVLATVAAQSGDQITGCYLKSTGILRVIDPAVDQCRSTETQLVWSVTGPGGPQGPQGIQGPIGPAGPAGVTDAYFGSSGRTGIISDNVQYEVAKVTLPPGNYVLFGKGGIVDLAHTATVHCSLRTGDLVIDIISVGVEDADYIFRPDEVAATSYVLNGRVSLPAGGDVRMACNTSADGVDALNNRLTAIKVTTLH